MNKLLNLTTLLLFLITSCGEEKKERINTEIADSTIKENNTTLQDSLILKNSDALKQKKDSLKLAQLKTNQNTVREINLSLYNKPYQLTIKNFLLSNKEGSDIKINDGAANILLKQKNKKIIDITIRKELFKDNYFKEEAYLGLLFSHAEYKFFRSNRIFFNVYLIDPEKDKKYEIMIGIDYQDKPGDIMIATTPNTTSY